jgi:spore maturation protein CgeB
MKRKLKVLLAAKPWQGGLYQYYLNAFDRRNDVEVYLHFTYPNTLKDYASYKTDKRKWFKEQVKIINRTDYDLGFFINTFPDMDDLRGNNNVLYLTDGAAIKENILALFKNIYISDMGYANKFKNNKDFLGELPFAFDPHIHKQSTVNNKKKLIQSIANRNGSRDKWFNLMDEHNCLPDLYGNYFVRSKLWLFNPLKVKPSINFRNQYKVYSNYSLSLNIHSNVIKNGTNLKTFEASGFKVAQLVEFKPGLDDFFEPDTEIMVFSNIEEYKEKLALLKKDKNLRKLLVSNSYKRAMANHTYDNRIKFVIDNYRSTGVQKENTVKNKNLDTLPSNDFGFYAPKGLTRVIYNVVRLGTGLGILKKLYSWLIDRLNSENPIDIKYHGILFRLYPHDNTIESKMIVSSRLREAKELEVISSYLKNGGTFLDIGANVGYYSLMAAKLGATRTIGIEPNPVVLGRFKENIRFNGFEKKIKTFQLGIGKNIENRNLYLSKVDLGSSSILGEKNSKDKIKIKILPLSVFLKRESVRRVDVMKIDIEGYEDKALFPYFKTLDKKLYPRLILMEDSSQKDWDKNILEWLLTNGYSVITRTRGNILISLES